MIPRFANPHLLQQHTEITSRAALFAYGDEDEETGNVDTSRAYELDELLKATLGDPATLNERPKKRRKLEKAAAASSQPEPQSTVEFKLVSSTLPPLPICLEPKPAPVIKYWEPPCEDDEEEANARSDRARAAAVDVSWLLAESKRSYVPRPNESRKLLSAVSPDSITGSQPLLVLQWPKPPNKRAHFLGTAPNPSPHEISVKGNHRSIMSIRLAEEPAAVATGRKRRARRR